MLAGPVELVLFSLVSGCPEEHFHPQTSFLDFLDQFGNLGEDLVVYIGAVGNGRCASCPRSARQKKTKYAWK